VIDAACAAPAIAILCCRHSREFDDYWESPAVHHGSFHVAHPLRILGNKNLRFWRILPPNRLLQILKYVRPAYCARLPVC